MGITVGADLVIFGGNVITIDNKKPRAQGGAITDGRFLWVGAGLLRKNRNRPNIENHK